MREERKLSLMSEPIDEPSAEERKLSLVAARVVLSVPPGPERSVSIPVGAMVGARVAPRSGRLGAVGGLLSVPPHARCSALLLHPHPGRGGDMYNAFITSIFVLLRNRGVATLRFNFSTGDDETDETGAPADAEDDLEALLRCNKAEAQAAVETLREKMPEGAPVVLVGFSWGAVISLALARDDPQRIQALALVAPPINVLPPGMHPSRGDFARWPILLTAGDADEYCDVGRLRAIAGGAATTCLVLDGVTHFLHGETAQAAALQVDAWVGSLTL
jgi:alpha/beta superfamily hydrolase